MRQDFGTLFGPRISLFYMNSQHIKVVYSLLSYENCAALETDFAKCFLVD